MCLKEIILDLLNLENHRIIEDNIDLKFYRTSDPTIIEQRLYYKGTNQEIVNGRMRIKVIPGSPYDST